MSLQDHRFLKSRPGEIASQKLFQDYDRVLQNNPSYTFLTGIVKDVVSNPYEYLRREFENTGVPLKDVLTGRFKPEIGNPPKPTDVSSNIVNKELIESMPINSIFAYIVDGNKARDKGEYVVCYPFFPPHLSLPLKAGEYVWVVTEKIGSLTYYYWMCRKVGSIYVDDLNFTNLERSPAANAMIVQKRKQPAATLDLDEVYSLNEIKDKYNNAIKGVGTTNMPEPLASLFNNSYSHNVEFTGEPVPRLHKDCGDLLFQGSNNAGIHITTEKFASNPLKYQETSANVGGMPNSTPRSSAIDIYVGRKKSSIESARFNRTINSDPDKIGKMAFNVNNSDNPAYEYVENDKFANIRLNDDNVYDSELRDNAGDARDIAARLYLSHDSSPDLIFGSAFDVLSPKFGESIVTFADVNRVVGSQNARMVSIAGESFIDLDTNGNIVLKASIDNGQQFLSLSNNGVTRLQARDKMQLAVRPNNKDPEEPYILYSELKIILDKIITNLLILNDLYLDNIGNTFSLATSTSAAATVTGQASPPAGLGLSGDALDEYVNNVVKGAMVSLIAPAETSATQSTGATKITSGDTDRTGSSKSDPSPLGSTKIFGEWYLYFIKEAIYVKFTI